MLILSLVCSCNMWGQVVLQGNINDEEGNAVPFATVVLSSQADSTAIVCSDIADTKGQYRLGNIRPGNYVVMVSFVGYETHKEEIRLRMPTGTNVVNRDFTLTTTPYGLSEVTVSGSRKTTGIGRSTHTFTAAQIKAARHAVDLLENVEDLTTDIQTGNIARLNGASVKILINGVNATTTDLKSIPAGKIQKVVYYNVPPMKYIGSGVVVDVITKRLDTGVTGGIDLSHAVWTGFFNDEAYCRYVSGNSQLSIDYSVNYRNYTERYGTDGYQYNIGNDVISQTLTAPSFARHGIESELSCPFGLTQTFDRHDKFGYTTHTPHLKYAYQLPDKMTFQLSLSPSFQTRFNKSLSDVTTMREGTTDNGTATTDNKSKVFGPSLDVYFARKFSDSHELSANLLGTYYHSRQDKGYVENSGTSELVDDITQRTDKYSIIGEIADSHKRFGGELNLGARLSYVNSRSTISNALSDYSQYGYDAENKNVYLYGEYSGVLKKFMYQVSLGGTYVWEGNDETRFHKILFTPRLVIMRQFAGGHTLQYQLQSDTNTPSITQLSNNSEYITSFLLHTGNPYLKSELNRSHLLTYNFKNQCLDLTLAAVYDHTDSPIAFTYRVQSVGGEQRIVYMESNACSFSQYGGYYSATLKPLKELLTLRLYGLCLRQRLKADGIQGARNWYAPVFYQVSLRRGNWSASYRGAVVSTQIKGSILERDENTSHLQIAYQYKNWRFNMGCMWMFTKSKYHQEYLANPLVQHMRDTYINDNRSMLVLGFSWNFQRGKGLTLKKNINNKDSDDGLF